MRLIHYSKERLDRVHSVPQRHQGASQRLYKPVGLWVSVEGDDDWKEWCEGEGFGLERLKCATEIVLSDEPNILHLRGACDLDAFHAECAIDFCGGLLKVIDWPRVTEKYNGIIIAPYVYARRLDTRVSDWYYGWDCASGCIWNADAVAEVKPIEVAQAA